MCTRHEDQDEEGVGEPCNEDPDCAWYHERCAQFQGSADSEFKGNKICIDLDLCGVEVIYSDNSKGKFVCATHSAIINKVLSTFAIFLILF